MKIQIEIAPGEAFNVEHDEAAGEIVIRRLGSSGVLHKVAGFYPTAGVMLTVDDEDEDDDEDLDSFAGEG